MLMTYTPASIIDISTSAIEVSGNAEKLDGNNASKNSDG